MGILMNSELYESHSKLTKLSSEYAKITVKS